MKTFIKENWFKIGILFLIILSGCVLSYYLMVFEPAKDEAIREANYQKETEIHAVLNTQKQTEEKEKAVINQKNDTIARYRETCSGYEKKNSQNVDNALNAIRISCNKEDDPVKCMTQGSQSVMDSLGVDTGSDYIQTCVENMIKKYGTN